VSYAGEFTLLKGIAYPLTVEAPWTAVVGLAGIAAAFFAPTYSQRRLEQRREKREYRRAKALVLAELAEVVETLETLSEEIPSTDPKSGLFAAVSVREHGFFETPEWSANKNTLADSLDPDDFEPLVIIFTKVAQNRSWFLHNESISAEIVAIFVREAEEARAARERLLTAIPNFD
jgi:hypothetical protein